MPLPPPARRSLAPWLLVALGMIGLAALALVGGGEAGWGLLQERAPTSEEAALELEAARAAEASRGGPRLESTPGATPRATQGPVVVRVLDLQGKPCAGVRLEAWIAPEGPKEDPGAEDTTATYEVLRATCDAFGQARFDDLPYDGRAKVRALARVSEDADAESARAVVTTQVPVLQKLPVLTFRFNAPTEDSTGAPSPEPGDPRLTPEDMEHLVATDAQEATITIVDAPPPGLLGEAVVEGPEVNLTIDAGLPLSVEAREGGAGRLRRDAGTRVWPRLAWEAPTVGETRVVAKPGSAATIHCRVEPPEGWIARKVAEWSATIHPLATRLEAVYPLRPAVDVIVELPAEVMPYRVEDWEGTITVAGIQLEAPELRVDGRGRLHVRGGAHVVGDRVDVDGVLGRRFRVTGAGFIGPDPREPVRVQATAIDVTAPPASAAEPNVIEFTLDLGQSVVIQDHRVVIQGGFVDIGSAPIRLLGELSRVPGSQRGFWVPPVQVALPLRVVAWNGAPAAGARLRWGAQDVIADAQGRVRLEGVPEGVTAVTLLGAGAPVALPLEIGPAPRSEMTLTAPQGGVLEVEVVDTLGRPLPFAHVDVKLPADLPHMDCVDGVQRIDPYTDAAGRRTYRFVTPGRVSVTAHFGTRSTSVELDVADAATHPVRLVLPVHAPPPPPDGTPR